MAQPQNQAAWITAPNTRPFDIQDAPYPSPGPGELVIKSAATAIVGYHPWILADI
jgi:D-arabinose 1-dehydrogenase-like Zn-dependent alcohol dehydrogenase